MTENVVVVPEEVVPAPAAVAAPERPAGGEVGLWDGLLDRLNWERFEMAWAQSLQPAMEWFVWTLTSMFWLLGYVGHYFLSAILFVINWWKAFLLFTLVFKVKWLFRLLWAVISWYSWFLDLESPIPTTLLWSLFRAEVQPAPVVAPPIVVAPPLPVVEPFFMGFDKAEVILLVSGIVNVLMLFVVVGLIMKPRRVRRVCEHGFVVERSMEGSNALHSPNPGFILEVWVQHAGGKKFRAGTAFRVEGFIFTATHVVVGADRVWFRFGNEEREVTEKPTQIDLDVARYSYEPFSSWQLGSGKLAPRFTNQFCKVHNGDFETYGRLTKSLVVGMVEYTGTTLPSFSGAPYFVGRTVYGIHMGAGVVNQGYDAAFIRVLLSSIPKKESAGEGFTSDPQELYEEMMRSGKELEYRHMSNDYYVVRIGDAYQTYDEEEFERTFARYNKRNTGQPSYEPEGVTSEELAAALFAYQDAEPVEELSGNDNGPVASVTPVAGPSSVDQQKDVQSDLVVPVPMESNCPMPTGIAQKPIPGHKLVAARQNALSRNTLEDLLSLIRLMRKCGFTVLELRALKALAAERFMKEKGF
uniref:Serine protease n=1 Tax=Riboviria sp. TaxID=2585031 RepID=A0A8K1U271_9VIRU|nr:MAG: hypothetical protein 1 [Riboviria sp.]